MKFLFVSLFLLNACASQPPFRPLSDGLGYAAKETAEPGVLDLRVELPPGTKDEVRAEYLARAAGEACAEWHFPYFDAAWKAESEARAYCYQEAHAPNVNAVFGMVTPERGRRALRVLGTPSGKLSPLRQGDVVRKVSGEEVQDAAAVKDALARARKKKLGMISMQVERSDIPLSLQMPLYDDGSLLSNPDTLAELRAKVQ